MKVMILGNQSRSMSIFWKVLIRTMIKKNMETICVAPPGDDDSDGELASLGARVIHYPLERKGLNPFNDLRSFLELRKIIAREKPDMLFAVTIKPVIYGCMAASLAKTPGIFATITGLGYAFEADSIFKKIINRISIFLYKIALKPASGIFFQNRDDSALFEKCGILAKNAKVFFARGTGVDAKFFSPRPFPPLPPEGPMVFLLVARLLEAKGIYEYAGAARILKAKYPRARFQLLGPVDTGPGCIDKNMLDAWQAEGILEYLGESRDVRPFVAAAHALVLPSWREGTPTVVMEAMSMGRPCIVTDVPGCREVVIDGENGFLARCRDPEDLAIKMEKFLLAPQAIPVMGENGRHLAVEKFDAYAVAEGIIRDMLAAFPRKSMESNNDQRLP